MKNNTHYLFFCYLSAFLLTVALPVLAVDSDMVLSQPDSMDSELPETYLPAGTRALSPAECLTIQKQRAAEKEQTAIDSIPAGISVDPSEFLRSQTDSLEAFFPAFSTYKAGYYYTSHPGAFHRPIAFALLGETVTLEDSSIWVISPEDSYKTLNWLVSDVVVITPNHLYFSMYSYRLVNQNTGVSVQANLSVYLNPYYHGVYNHRVIALDDVLQMIWLEDGSAWSVTGWDYSMKWGIGDTVIIGVNDGVFASSRPNILINANMLHFVRARCVR